METVIFRNRLIAEFMGHNIIPYDGTEQLIYNGNKYAKTTGQLKQLWGGLDVQFTGRFVDRVKYPYDTDFNYLIPIIRRIEEMGFVIAEVTTSAQGLLTNDEAEANAKLIAAAPDMLLVLKEAVDHAHVYDTNPALIELFTAVINKATL